jgi:hypothetical protein
MASLSVMKAIGALLRLTEASDETETFIDDKRGPQNRTFE